MTEHTPDARCFSKSTFKSYKGESVIVTWLQRAAKERWLSSCSAYRLEKSESVSCSVSCSESPTLCNSMDCSPPGSSVHGILQTRILKWVAIPFSRGSSWPQDRTQVSRIAGRFFTVWATSLNQTPFHCGGSFRASKFQSFLGCFGLDGPSSLCYPFCRHSGFSFCTFGPFLIHLPKIWCYFLYQLLPPLLFSSPICACSLYILWLSFWASVLGRIGDKCTHNWSIRSAWKRPPE